MNKTTVAVTESQYKEIISLIQNGFEYEKDGEKRIFRPNKRLAMILTLETNLGLRISDVLQLRLASIIQDGNRYRLDIHEQKTDKKRVFTVPLELYTYIQAYALQEGIHPKAKLFDISYRAVNKQLMIVAEYLKLENISTHSFRKFFATSIYVNSNYNIELVRILLQHSSTSTTQKYIGIQPKEVEEALENHLILPPMV